MKFNYRKSFDIPILTLVLEPSKYGETVSYTFLDAIASLEPGM